MSQESLRRLVERINADAAFRARIEKDPINTLREADISAVEFTALAYDDEDALRRLLGDAEVTGYSYVYFGQWVTRGIFGPQPTTAAPLFGQPQTFQTGSY
jgi:hypothetical protein